MSYDATLGAGGWTVNPIPAATSAVGVLWNPVTFTPSVLLSGASWMPSQAVSSVIAFTPNTGSARAGASNYVRLRADGTNVPTFTGFTEHGSSSGYDNRANFPNWVTFWFDGATYWYSIQQAATSVADAVPDTTAPTFTSAAVGAGAPTKIVLTYSEALGSTLTGAITVGGSAAKTVSSQTVVGSTVEVVVNSAYIFGDTITVTVPAGCVKDVAGNSATALTAQAVTNGIGAATSFLRFNTLTSMTESGDATAGYVYTSTASFNTANAAGASLSLPANTDGSFTGTSVHAQSGPLNIYGFKSTNAAGNFNTYTVAIYMEAGGFKVIPGLGAPSNPAVAAAGDQIRMRRVGSNFFADISKDNGATFTLLHAFGTTSVAQMWPVIDTNTGSSMGPFTTVGMT